MSRLLRQSLSHESSPSTPSTAGGRAFCSDQDTSSLNKRSGATASTVNGAFDEFLRNEVNLSPPDSDGARTSRDWLSKQIQKFPENFDDFPLLYPEQDIAFGSFARKTKIRPLDDVDIISCLHATGGTYADYGFGPIDVTVPGGSRLSGYCHNGSSTLNSIRIVNRYVKALATVSQYSSAEINRRSEAAVLRLTSYDWNFDIVPGFFTGPDAFGRTYYLIPDGNGHWKKTDPRKDRDHISKVNQEHDGHVLNVVRAAKHWQRRRTMPTASSYLLETIVAGFYEGRVQKATKWVDMEMGPVLRHIANAILSDVQDPKEIQGNLNTLSWDEKLKIRERALLDADRADEARTFEDSGEHEKAISKWRDIFGSDFPRFG